MDLVEQLSDIIKQQKFDYIVIEASGICEPAPIAQTICSIPTMGGQYVQNGVPRMDCIVTVVDAVRMQDEFANGDKLMNQNLDEDDIENPKESKHSKNLDDIKEIITNMKSIPKEKKKIILD